MKPMQPMKPLEPMKPMEPMRPLDVGEAWWPRELGQPSTAGGQGGLRYAVFPDKRRLVIERDGTRTIYDSGDRRIGGVQQQSGGTPAFSSDQGTVPLDALRVVG